MGYDDRVEHVLKVSAAAALRAAQAIGQEGLRLRAEAEALHAEVVLLRHRDSRSEVGGRILADRLLAEAQELVAEAYGLSRAAQALAGTSRTHAPADAGVLVISADPDRPAPDLQDAIDDLWSSLPREDDPNG